LKQAALPKEARLPLEIRAFFDSYRDAFDRLDGDALAAHFAVPSGIVSDGAYVHWLSLKSVRENMRALCKQYADNGYVSARYEPATFLELGDDCAIADIVWTISCTKGREPWRFNTTYNLLRTREGWRVLLCTAYQEKRLDRRGA
jgi:hypothetical protein